MGIYVYADVWLSVLLVLSLEFVGLFGGFGLWLTCLSFRVFFVIMLCLFIATRFRVAIVGYVLGFGAMVGDLLVSFVVGVGNVFVRVVLCVLQGVCGFCLFCRVF